MRWRGWFEMYKRGQPLIVVNDVVDSFGNTAG